MDGVSLSFGDTPVIRNLSLSVHQGEFVTLLGPSGCGKTTLLKLIGGFFPPDQGRIAMGGRDVTSTPPERRPTTMCFQSYALFPHISVADNVTFGLRQQRLSATEVRQRLNEVVGQLNLESQQHKFPSELSGGQQQRVALARALIMRSDIILFDEPLSNLDAQLRDQVRVEILQLHRKLGFTAIYVTHDQAEALAMSDRVVILNGGRIAQMGPPEEVYLQPRNRFIAEFMGAANLVEGWVKARNGGFSTVETPMGLVTVGTQGSPFERIALCWRPEDAVLGSHEGPNRFSGIVEVSVYQGHRTDILLRVGDGQGLSVRLQTPGFNRLSEGTTVAFSLPPDRIHLLEPSE